MSVAAFSDARIEAWDSNIGLVVVLAMVGLDVLRSIAWFALRWRRPS